MGLIYISFGKLTTLHSLNGTFFYLLSSLKWFKKIEFENTKSNEV